MKESFNYGLFYPPCNGRAGKFLDEERPLSDYPFNGPGGYLEVKLRILYYTVRSSQNDIIYVTKKKRNKKKRKKEEKMISMSELGAKLFLYLFYVLKMM